MTNRAYWMLLMLAVVFAVWGVGCNGQGADWDGESSVWKPANCKLGFIDYMGKPRVVTIPNCPAGEDDEGTPPIVDEEGGDDNDDVSDESVAACIKEKCKGLTGKTRAACNHACQGKS